MGCRTTAAPDALVRVVRATDGSLLVGRARPGRGAWLCPTSACLTAAVRRDAFSRAFRAPVPRAAVERLGEDIGLRPGTLGDRPGPGAPATPDPPRDDPPHQITASDATSRLDDEVREDGRPVHGHG